MTMTRTILAGASVNAIRDTHFETTSTGKDIAMGELNSVCEKRFAKPNNLQLVVIPRLHRN